MSQEKLEKSSSQDQALAAWMAELKFELVPDQFGNKRFDRYIGPDDMNLFADEALFFYTICQKAEREAVVKAETIPRQLAKDWANTRLSERKNAYDLLCEASKQIWNLLPPQAPNQTDLINFVKDPETIKRAVEGSVDKRLKRLNKTEDK